MKEKDEELFKRFKQFAIAIILFARKLPKIPEYKTIRDQMIDSATSSAANYRAAGRGKSNADFINKLKITEEELDETMFWLELTVGVSEEWRPEIAPLWKEANELLSITVASINTSRRKKKEP
ncbi:MAG: four helix bundle protein [Thermoanaerobaculia bacterium]|nr:four helix bundle protein [Thermoanaerobaculia bacterium]